MLCRRGHGDEPGMSLLLVLSLVSQAAGMAGCYVLYRRKGKDPRAGLAIGFALGLVGVFVAARLLRDARPV
jgi:hypothetical protein